jgi:trans-L-3-hydroxyproline dehydratase
MIHILKTIDAHVGGEPMRLVIDGLPRPAGKTMAHKRDWMKRHADHLRRALVLEPRGHRDMCAALLTDPVSPGSAAGVLFFQNDGDAGISGHGIIAAATIALERGLLSLPGGNSALPGLAFDTVAGTVQVKPVTAARADRLRIESVAFTNVPSFVSSGGHAVRLGTRELKVDIAFGGVFYAMVDTEAIGIPLTIARLPELRRLGVEIRTSIHAAGKITHPADADLSGIAGVIFTGPPENPEAHLRNVTIFGDGAADRSPCATATSAVMAVLDAMGLLQDDQPFVHESVIGTLHRGRVGRRTQVGELPALHAEVEGTAWITGEHAFHVDDDDPLKAGLLI